MGPQPTTRAFPRDELSQSTYLHYESYTLHPPPQALELFPAQTHYIRLIQQHKAVIREI